MPGGVSHSDTSDERVTAAVSQRGRSSRCPEWLHDGPDLFPGVPALENAAIKLLADRVPLPEARRTARPWLERVGLGDRLSHTPDQLSGGERARVAVARALVNQPRLLLADEPTANLDTRRGLEVVDLLASAAREQDVAVLLVTHDQEAAAVADRIETLRDGSLGSPMPLDRTAIS